MTPQLQQAIRLLQLSTLELQQEIQLALESNPLLEQTDLHDEIDAKETQETEGSIPARRWSRKTCRKSCRWTPPGMRSTPPARRPAPAPTTATTNCRSIRARPPKRCRIT
ncbi:hypothetical protein M5585_06180 [Serratia ureilytica]